MLEFLLKNWMLVLTALVSGFFLVWPQIKGKGGAGSVSTDEAVRPSMAVLSAVAMSSLVRPCRCASIARMRKLIVGPVIFRPSLVRA